MIDLLVLDVPIDSSGTGRGEERAPWALRAAGLAAEQVNEPEVLGRRSLLQTCGFEGFLAGSEPAWIPRS